QGRARSEAPGRSVGTGGFSRVFAPLAFASLRDRAKGAPPLPETSAHREMRGGVQHDCTPPGGGTDEETLRPQRSRRGRGLTTCRPGRGTVDGGRPAPIISSTVWPRRATLLQPGCGYLHFTSGIRP